MTTSQTSYKAKTMQAYDASAAELAQEFDGFLEQFACQGAVPVKRRKASRDPGRRKKK